jgi:hypothetical protein
MFCSKYSLVTCGVSFTREFTPNFDLENTILACRKDFSLEKNTQVCQIFGEFFFSPQLPEFYDKFQ